MVLKPNFVIWPDQALSRKAQARPVDAAMHAAGQALLEAATAAQAYGLAAAHLGLDQPCVVLSITPDTTRRDYAVLYNPEITAASDELATGPEGSVSMPGIEAPITRSVWVDVRYTDEAGQIQSARFEGFVARVAQHEIEQMNGVFFLARLSRLKRDTAIRKFEKARR